MKNGNILLLDLEFEHKLWKGRLELFIYEVDLFIKYNQLLPKERGGSTLNSIQLLALEEHKENLNRLINKIETKEEELKFYNKDFPITDSHEYFREHIELRQENEQIMNIHLDRAQNILNKIGVQFSKT